MRSTRSKVDEAIRVAADVPPELRSVVVGEVLRWLLRTEDDGGSTQAAPVDTSVDLPGTLVETLATLRGRSLHETLVAIAVYRLRKLSIPSLTVRDLTDAYREARLPRPQNISDTIAKAMRKGWIVPADARGGQKAWRVTELGLRAFEGWR